MKEITVQIKVQEYNDKYYLLFGRQTVLVHKEDCTVIDPVDSVQPEVKGWCIKRTPENRDELNAWANNAFELENKCTTDGGWILSKPTEGCMFCHEVSINRKNGFTEVFTVEEFFEKVGYTASPKLIAKAGEWVKPIDLANYKGDSIIKDKPYELKYDYFEGGNLTLCKNENGSTNIWYASSLYPNGVKFEVCHAPVQRKSLGFYEGTEIFPETKAWYINLRTLEIVDIDCTMTINEYIVRDWPGYDGFSSKVYLDPKEANARLKKEVEKKAKDYKLSISECVEATQHSTPLAYAIQQVEQQYGVTYLTE